MQLQRNDSGIEKALMDVTLELTPPQTFGLTDSQSEIVLSKYAEAYKGKYYCPHYTISADEITKKLKLDLRAAPLVFTWSFDEAISLFSLNKVQGHFEGFEFREYYGIQEVNNQPASMPVTKPIESIKGAFLMYQVDENGDPIDGMHDIEIMVTWNTQMTRTQDYLLIEALFERLSETDFSLEELEQRLAEIY